MARDLIIIGAGGTSREVAALLANGNHSLPEWNVLGFLDDDPARQGESVDGLRVLGPVSLSSKYAAEFIVGIASVKDLTARKRMVHALGLAPERFATVIHPSASISSHASVGMGTAIMQNVVVSSKTEIGNHVIVHYNSAIAHDCRIGDFVTMAPGTLVSGHVRVGANAYLGSGCRIMDHVVVGADAVVGIGAVVVRDVAPGTRVLGNPARVFSAV